MKDVLIYYRRNLEDNIIKGIFKFPNRELNLSKCDYYRAIKEILDNEDILISVDDTWCFVNFKDVNLPIQGWKIHISAIPSNSIEILEKTAKILVNNKLPFKFLKTIDIFFKQNSKNSNRASSGKFITIYPPNEQIFKEIINKLYLELKDYEGPYILSDKRFKDCKVIYYRYGGFLSITKSDYLGQKKYYIKTPNNSLYEDKRKPYYYLPYFVNDIFDNKRYDLKKNLKQEKNNIILNDRYLIKKALSYKNTGGIYLAQDLISNQKVIIKEARPYTNYRSFDFDTVYNLYYEYSILLKLNDIPQVIKVKDIFNVWEHHFLVLEYFKSKNLHKIISENLPYYFKTLSKFNNLIYNIFSDLLCGLKEIHKKGVIHGDLSVNNIIVNKKGEVRIIDFEGAFLEWYSKKLIPFYTPGFVFDINKKTRDFFDDLYSFCVTLFYSLYGPINEIVYLKPNYIHTLIYDLVKYYKYPLKVADIFSYVIDKCTIYQNTNKQIDNKIVNKIDNKNIDEIYNSIEEMLLLIKNSEFKEYLVFNKDEQRNIKTKELKEIKQKLLEFIEKVKFLNNEIPFPLSNFAYKTNPLSFGYGISGILKILKIILKDDFEYMYSDVVDYFYKSIKKIDITNIDDYSPNFMTGLAGVALTAYDLSITDQAFRILSLVNKHRLLKNKNFSFFYGLPGIAYVNLYFYEKTKENKYLDFALILINKILKNKKELNEKIYFSNYVGLANGQAGIALLFLYFYKLTNNNYFLELAIKTILFDLSFEISTNSGKKGFPYSTKNKFVSPYLEYGIAGIAKVLYEINNYLHFDQNYKLYLNDFSDRLKEYESSVLFFNISSPTYFVGLAGILDFLCDIKSHYCTSMFSLLNNFIVYTKYGLSFPSEMLRYISLGFGDGISGILYVIYKYLIFQESENNHFSDIFLFKI
jgi:serine/threonine protein kinase